MATFGVSEASVGVLAANAVVTILAAHSHALILSIFDEGSEANRSVSIRVTSGGYRFHEITSPSGDRFDSDAFFINGLLSNPLRSFGSPADAAEYITGTWQVTLQRSGFPGDDEQPMPMYEASFAEIPPDEIIQTAPTLLTPLPGRVIRNESTFRFDWDYLGDGELPHGSHLMTTPLFDPASSGSLSIFSTPSPNSGGGGSGSSGTGDRRFSHRREKVPGADGNRWLFTFAAAEAALPLDVELALGSYVPLHHLASVQNATGFDPPFLPVPNGGVYYSRQLDPFVITLSSVPEPTSLGSASLLLLSCALWRSPWHCVARRRRRARR